MKKVLFKVWKFPRTSETFILAQIITAIKCGYEVKILVKDLEDIENSKHRDLLFKYNILEKVIIEDYKIHKRRFPRVLKGFYLFLKNIFNLFHLIHFYKCSGSNSILFPVYQFHFFKKFRKFDIIHVQYGTNGRPLDILKKINYYKSKLIISFHGHDAFFPINGVISNNGYYNNLFDQAELIVANTPYLRDIIRDLGCPLYKIKVIPVGVDTNFFTPTSLSKEINNLKLISVGRLDKIKGHRHAIELVERLLIKKLNVTLTIVGEGEERRALEEMIKMKSISQSVSLIGKRTPLEIRELLRSHHIYILPSVPVEQNRMETQGLATLEAQACGLPAIVYNCGGVKYTVEDGKTGFVIPLHKLSSMEEKIIDLYHHPKKIALMGEAAVIQVKKKFDQEKINQIWCETYNSLLNVR